MIERKKSIIRRKMMNDLDSLAREFLESKKKNDNTYRKDFSYAKYNKTLEKILNIKDDLLFEKVILANKKDLEFYISKYIKYLRDNKYELKSIDTLSKENEKDDIFKELLSLHNTYTSFSSIWNKRIVDNIDTRTCLYCNREYVINFIDSVESKTTAELDHFYPRSLYPFLSISFYNLIPSCKTCNSKLKGDIDTFKNRILYPYEESLNNNLEFKLRIDDSNFINSKGSFSLDIKTKNSKSLNSKELFKLKELYQEHKDIVLELIQKREIYPDSYIDDLFNQYEGTLFKNREDLLRLITGGYIEDKNINKRPLSKLIKDISEELDLI